MKFTAQRDSLLPSLLRVLGAVGRSSTLPILDHMLLRIDESGHLQLTATDLEIQISARTPVGPREPGATTVPARKLADIVRLLPENASVAFDLDGDKMKLKSGRGRYGLATRPADQYPAFDCGETTHRIELPAAALLTAIQKSRFAIAHGDVRYYLNGLALQIEPGTLRTVSSDGHRLALCEMPVDAGDTPTDLVIVPSKGIDELARLLRDDLKATPNRTVELHLRNNSLTVRIGNVELSSKLIEGRFPDYHRTLPRSTPLTCHANRADLIAALQRVIVLAGDNLGIAFYIGSETITLSTANGNAEEAEDIVPITELQGDPQRLGYSARYLLDALGIPSGDEVKLSFSEAGGCLFEDPSQDARSNWCCLVMPMSL